MKSIGIIRKRFRIIGIDDYDQSSRLYPFNGKSLMVLLMYAIDLIINGIFLLDGAESFQEYVNSMFTCSTLIVSVMGFEVVIWKMAKLFEFLKKLEKTIEKRK